MPHLGKLTHIITSISLMPLCILVSQTSSNDVDIYDKYYRISAAACTRSGNRSTGQQVDPPRSSLPRRRAAAGDRHCKF